MKNKIKLIAIMGKAGSGKDSLMQAVLKAYPEVTHEIVSYTTRPMREGETNGKNYWFITPEEFGEKVLKNEMLECTSFNDWFYGTGRDSLSKDKINIGVFNPDGVDALYTHLDIDLTIYYLRVSDKQRLLRQLNREENPDCHEIMRRFRTDWIDFDGVEDDFPVEELFNETPADFDKNVAIIGERIKRYNNS